MNRLFAILSVFAAVVCFTARASADETCDAGDRQYGPNCVHVNVYEECAADPDCGIAPTYETIIYRKIAGTYTVVWKADSPRQITVVEMQVSFIRIRLNGKVQVFTWNGSTYR